MRCTVGTVVVLAVAVIVGQLGGCNSSLFTHPVDVGLSGELAQFDVEAGVATRQTAEFTLDTGGVTIGSGSLALDPDAITVVPASTGGGKRSAALQGTQSLEITVWMGDDVGTVCDAGGQYGPVAVALDDRYQPVSISPSTVTLTAGTRAPLNAGAFAVCIEVISPIDSTIIIDPLRFNVGL